MPCAVGAFWRLRLLMREFNTAHLQRCQAGKRHSTARTTLLQLLDDQVHDIACAVLPTVAWPARIVGRWRVPCLLVKTDDRSRFQAHPASELLELAVALPWHCVTARFPRLPGQLEQLRPCPRIPFSMALPQLRVRVHASRDAVRSRQQRRSRVDAACCTPDADPCCSRRGSLHAFARLLAASRCCSNTCVFHGCGCGRAAGTYAARL